MEKFHETLEELDGKRIENPWSPREISMMILDEWNANELEDVVIELGSGSTEETINSSFLTSVLGVNTWAAYSHKINHSPEEISDADFQKLYEFGVDTANEAPGIRLAMIADTVGKKLARHVSEKTFVMHEKAKNISMAPESVEFDRIDAYVGENESIQILTSNTSDGVTPTGWKDKYDLYGEENAEEKAGFDYYVVLKMNDDGTFGIGVEKVEKGYTGTNAETKAKKA